MAARRVARSPGRNRLVVLVVAADPADRYRQIVFIPTLRRPVKQLIGAVEPVETTGVTRIRVVDDAAIERKRAQSRQLCRPRLLGEVVDPTGRGSTALLCMSETEVPAGHSATETPKS